jgi:hypothetical protein
MRTAMERLSTNERVSGPKGGGSGAGGGGGGAASLTGGGAGGASGVLWESLEQPTHNATSSTSPYPAHVSSQHPANRKEATRSVAPIRRI